jgi:mannosyl-3-phosphoglycerate phosphatase
MHITPVIAFADADAIPASDAGCIGPVGADALAALARERIFIVLSSSRTRAQMESTRQALGVFHPFIAEAGAAAFVPERYFAMDIEVTRKIGGYQALEFCAPYEQLVTIVRRTADRLGIGIAGFNDMSVEQVARECSVSLLEARLAKLREYREPFRLLCANSIAERRLLRALEAAGVRCTRQEDFFVAGTDQGVHQAVNELSALYRRALGGALTASTVEGSDAGNYARLVDFSLQPIPIPPGETRPARAWVLGLIDQITAVRGTQVHARAARFAR